MRIHDDILGTLGNTPMVRLDRFFPGPADFTAFQAVLDCSLSSSCYHRRGRLAVPDSG